jgi:glycerol-3-phosphate dehydrogenase (NAD(P)+)
MISNFQEIAVIGAGSWGTALAKLLSDKGHRVALWGHDQQHVETVQRERQNAKYLPGFSLADTLTAGHDLRQTLAGRPVIVMVVPSHVTREVFRQVLAGMTGEPLIISATKGIENETLLTMTQLMGEELRAAGKRARLGVLAGPSFAKEVAQRIPTAVSVAGEDKATAAAIQQIFFTDRFRVYTSTDLIGLELGGALKNPIAIAAGICDGAGLGTNTRAALITRGLAEITRLGVKMGASPLTFAGLGGLGDLVLTCTGDLSRNRTVGIKLGQGMKLAAILAEMAMVAEGVKTTRSAWHLACREKVEMPILEQMYQVLYEDKPCTTAVHELLTRDQKGEDEFSADLN